MNMMVLVAESATDSGGFDLGNALIVGVVATVIAAALIRLTVAIWRRRRRPLEWAADGRDALAERERRIEKASHDELVGHVLKRAEVLQIDLPVRVTLGNPAIVEVHPSGLKHARYRDFPSYRAGMARQEFSPTRSTFGKPPLVVSKWSDERLREWLRDHADELPSEGRAA